MILIDAIKSNTSITQCPRPYKDLKRLSLKILKRLQDGAIHIAQMEAAMNLAVGSTRATEKRALGDMKSRHKLLQNLESDIKTKLDELDKVLSDREMRDSMLRSDADSSL